MPPSVSAAAAAVAAWAEPVQLAGAAAVQRLFVFVVALFF